VNRTSLSLSKGQKEVASGPTGFVFTSIRAFQFTVMSFFVVLYSNERRSIGNRGQCDSALFILCVLTTSSPHGIIPTGSGPTLFTGIKFLISQGYEVVVVVVADCALSFIPNARPQSQLYLWVVLSVRSRFLFFLWSWDITHQHANGGLCKIRVESLCNS